MKTEDPADAARVRSIIYHCAEEIRIVGILLQPYMPGKSKTLLDMIGVAESRRTYDDAVFGCDGNYGVSKTSPGKCAWDALFPPLPIET